MGQLDASGGSGANSAGSMTYRRAESQHIVRMEPRIPGREYGPAATPYREAGAPEAAPEEDAKVARRAATKR